MHRDQPIAKRCGLLHRVGHHQRRRTRLGDEPRRQADHELGASRVERRGVLVEQKHLGIRERRHQQRDRLPLSAREEADRIVEPVLEPEPDLRQEVAPLRPFRTAKQRRQRPCAAALRRQRQVLRDGQLRRGAREGILEDPAHQMRPPMLRPAGHVDAVDEHATRIEFERSRDRTLKRALARAVGSDHHRERTGLECEVDARKRPHLVGGAGIEGLSHRLKPQHRRLLLRARTASSEPAGGGRSP